MEKDELLKIKETKDDITVVYVNAAHPEAVGHRSFRTACDAQAEAKAISDREKADKSKYTPMAVLKLWKPFGTTLALFEANGKGISAIYTQLEVRDLLRAHIATNSLVHPHNAVYIMPDNLLWSVLHEGGQEVAFIRRKDLLKAVLDAMQPWHSINGAPPKRGALEPILIETKIRVGSKWITYVSGFEDYAPHVRDLKPERLAEELCRLCAATTSSLIPGAAKGSEAAVVAVRGKQASKVADFFMSKGVPKIAIEEKTTVCKKKRLATEGMTSGCKRRAATEVKIAGRKKKQTAIQQEVRFIQGGSYQSTIKLKPKPKSNPNPKSNPKPRQRTRK
ncbi:hypothetical protein FRB95_009557 [Tulasnella sp. JGI-2019a]|nr:hypothetical protein FRB95_009557 [Tulasnella sp. JGI-2019a]